MKALFTMQGRLGRQQFILMTAAVIVSTVILGALVGVVAGVAGMSEDVAGVVGFVIGVIGSLIQAFLCVRRFHDLGRPGGHFWLLIIPLYNLYLYIVLLFSAGFSGENQYGTNPAT
jgi:uncharacterized membrane protein YhaH (DUF805 family)